MNYERKPSKIVFSLRPKAHARGFSASVISQADAVKSFINERLGGMAALEGLCQERRKNWAVRGEGHFPEAPTLEGLLQPCCSLLNEMVDSDVGEWIDTPTGRIRTRKHKQFVMGYWSASTTFYEDSKSVFHRDFCVSVVTRDANLGFSPEKNEELITRHFGADVYLSLKKAVLNDLSSLKICLDALRMSIDDIHWSTTASDRSLRLLERAGLPSRGSSVFLLPSKYSPHPRPYSIQQQIEEKSIPLVGEGSVHISSS
jgi:hypothetical protein